MKLHLQPPSETGSSYQGLPTKAIMAVDRLTGPEGSEATLSRDGIVILDLRISKTRQELLTIIEALMRQGFDTRDL